jgi:hypothetical protein
MNDLDTTRDQLNERLDTLLADDPLGALTAIGGVQRDVAARRGKAVRLAVQRHSWAEIGAALGVTKQAAHQKFAKEWAETLKGEVKLEHQALKAAQRQGSPERAAAAKARLDVLIAELKGANRRRK